MPPLLHLVRHGQAAHNVTNNFHLPDPSLTPLGHTQCAHLRSNFPHHRTATALMCSPLTRTIETAVEAFAPTLAREEVRLWLLPDAQEISGKGCDVGVAAGEVGGVVEGVLAGNGFGSGVAGLRESKVELGMVVEGWNSKKGPYAPTLRAVTARAIRLRQWLFARSEASIVLVTHGAFLHYLTEDWTEFDHTMGTAYKNCEYRTWAFTADSTAAEPHLEEVGKPRERLERPEGVNHQDLEGGTLGMGQEVDGEVVLEEEIVLGEEGVFQREN